MMRIITSIVDNMLKSNGKAVKIEIDFGSGEA
jgi:hypothetical protein